MILQFDHVLSDDALSWFKQDFESRIARKEHVVRDPWDPERIKQLYGIENCEALEYRVVLNDHKDPARKRLDQYLKNIIPEHIWYYAAYQRQFIPQNLHVDDILEDPNPEWCMTGIMPLDANPLGRHKTMIWQQQFRTTDEMFEWLRSQTIADHDHEPISDRYDIEHALELYSVVDRMPLLDVYDYDPGSLCLFTRTHMHSSSNWRKYPDESYKDFVLLHLG